MLSSNASETVYKTRRDIPSQSLANNTYEMFGSYSHPTTLRTSTREGSRYARVGDAGFNYVWTAE